MGYWLVFRRNGARNVFLLAASYIFYGWWNPTFLLLIFATSICSYVSGLAIERASGSGRGLRNRTSKAWLWGTVILNLGILGTFKYFDFFSHSFASLMQGLGWSVDSVTLNLVLPVGISFYTFQALSYVIDVYRGAMRPTRNLPAFLVFIGFFPQLVAGPIERATDLLPQFLRPRAFDYAEAVRGMRLILWGLFKKMVVADNAAAAVNLIFDDYPSEGTLNLWIGAFLFTFQIYCDFSGYSDIAVGTSKLFGIRLMRNFNFPYFSTSIYDFWKRWHISLTSWFRDYVYIPLGGNRAGKTKRIRNMMIVFLTSGLWHGANFTFIAWGAYHGLLYIPHVLAGRGKRGHALEAGGRWPRYFKSTFLMGTTLILVMIGWIIFRARHLSEAVQYISLMFAHSPVHVVRGKMAILWVMALVSLEWLSRKHDTPFDLPSQGLWRRKWVRWGVYLVTFMVVLFFSGEPAQFIYFQF